MSEIVLQTQRAITFVDYFNPGVASQRPFYNFGAGDWHHPHFCNIDLSPENYPGNRPDIEYDAMSMKPVPVDSGTALVFYFSHVNEHLPDAVNDYLFREVYRCLAPNGVVRFVYPCFDIAWEAYKRADRDFFFYREPKKQWDALSQMSFLELFVKQFANRALEQSPNDGNRKWSHSELEDLFNKYDRETAATIICSKLSMQAQSEAPGCHCNWWNQNKFNRMLSVAGFEEIYASAYLKSRMAPLRDMKFFDHKHPIISGYTEARKT